MILVVQGLRIGARYAERWPGFIVFWVGKNWGERRRQAKKCLNLYDPACRTKPSI
jgi:hypothetical protein